MKQFLFYAVACLLGLFLQSTFLRSFYAAIIAPDIILVLIVAISLQHRSVGGLLFAFLLGLLSDFASGEFLGPNAAGAVLAFGLVGAVGRGMYPDKVFTVVVLTFLCSLLKSLTWLLMVWLYTSGDVFREGVTRTVLMEGVLTAAVAPFVIYLIPISRGTSVGARVSSGSSYRWSAETR